VKILHSQPQSFASIEGAGADAQGVDGTIVPANFKAPGIAWLKTSLDVAGKPLGLCPSSCVVAQVNAAVVLIRAGALKVKEISGHLTSANAETEAPFLSRLCK